MRADADQRIRRWSRVALAAQVVFVVGWLVAGWWQGSHYSAVDHTISDMYADGAPHAWFLIVCVTLGGLGTVGFALFGLRPARRAAGRVATTGAVLLSVSILGLGDVLTPSNERAAGSQTQAARPRTRVRISAGSSTPSWSTVGLVAFVVARVRARPRDATSPVLEALRVADARSCPSSSWYSSSLPGPTAAPAPAACSSGYWHSWPRPRSRSWPSQRPVSRRVRGRPNRTPGAVIAHGRRVAPWTWAGTAAADVADGENARWQTGLSMRCSGSARWGRTV